ncbi:MAG: EF-hand domain-containing protein [Thermonemataceae bacterium]
MLTDFQKKKIARLFQFYDANGNGVIEAEDIDEIAQQFGQEFGWAIASPEDRKFRATFKQFWRKLIMSVDSNDDQKVNLEEFYAAYEASLSSEENYETLVRPFLDNLFPVIDSDNDGAWSKDDFIKFYRGFRSSSEAAERNFKRLDLNSDGVLSKEEIYLHFHDFHMSQDEQVAGTVFFGEL